LKAEAIMTATKSHEPAKEFVLLEHLMVELGPFVLGPVDLTLGRSQIFGLVGPNGSGKTTLINALLGLVPLTQGTAKLGGESMAGRPRHLLRRIGYVPDDTMDVIAELSARELWELHALAHARISGSVVEMLQKAESLASWLDFVPPDAPIGAFSHGMRKKTQIVAGLLHDPPLLILDEPHNALDPIAMERLDRLLAQEASRGHSLLLATHDLRFAERLADEICILNAGEVVAVGSPASLRANEDADLVDTFFRLIASHAE
jgi:ABC-2 type transport system ATP-binding protein